MDFKRPGKPPNNEKTTRKPFRKKKKPEKKINIERI